VWKERSPFVTSRRNVIHHANVDRSFVTLVEVQTHAASRPRERPNRLFDFGQLGLLADGRQNLIHRPTDVATQTTVVSLQTRMSP